MVIEKRSLYELESDRVRLLEDLEAAAGELTPDLQARWDALDTALLDAVDRYGWVITRLESEAAMYAERSVAMGAKALARRQMAKRLKERVTEHLMAVGKKQVQWEHFTVTVRESESIMIDPMMDLMGLPEGYVRLRAEADKDKLKQAIKRGLEFMGVSLQRKPYIVIK